MKLYWIAILIFSLSFSITVAQNIPKVYSNVFKDEKGLIYLINEAGEKVYAQTSNIQIGLKKMLGQPCGTQKGISLDFDLPDLNGILYYGFMNYDDSEHPQPVYFKRTATIEEGKTTIPIIDNLDGKYDMVQWQQKGKGTIGYRVVHEKGYILYNGKVSFKGTGPFDIDDTILEGPFVNNVSHESAIISFTTNTELIAKVQIDSKDFKDLKPVKRHEIKLTGLVPNTTYSYRVIYGDNEEGYSFTTAPKPGTRSSFTFAYASDSRSGRGGGERDVYGANFYIMKKIMALNSFKRVAFMQFTGDLINGYLNNIAATRLQYSNWKSSIEPFAHYFPVYVGMGNHEALVHSFLDEKDESYRFDRFPFESESAEQIFAENFVLPNNGPDSEDGSKYDPDPTTTDFPSYKENVYYYTHDNVAVIVLNSNYWFAPGLRPDLTVSGNLHGYIMDNQYKWLDKTLTELEDNENIDHVFITEHTPFFPNGGHVDDDMWYGGSNFPRPVIAGKGVEKGIIERRDQLLDIVVNKNKKVLAILTGDEHNYNRLMISPETEIYPENYEYEKITLNRSIWQINNGSAGAPYYAQQQTPWTPFVSSFTTQNVVVYFHINGKNVKMEVFNPDTLEPVDELVLR